MAGAATETTDAVEGVGRYVSRLEFVQKAVDTQLRNLAQNNPKAKVAIISFGSTVKLYTGSSLKPFEIHQNLDNFDQLLEAATKEDDKNFQIGSNIGHSKETLETVLKDLKPKGGTALGPALLTAVGIASEVTGSQVIICTDGIANVGVGSLEKTGNEELYTQVGQYAKKQGTIISVITVAGCKTKLEQLGKLADLTRGRVDIVDPKILDLSETISHKSIATGVQFTIYLEKSGKKWNFETYDEKNKKVLSSVIRKDVGNANAETQLVFKLVKNQEQQKGKKKSVKVQIQFEYTKPSGSKCLRCFTDRIKVTTNKETVLKDLDIRVVSGYLAQDCAEIARNGDYEGAMKNARSTKELLEKAGLASGPLWDLFLKEFYAIFGELGSELKKEEKSGGEVGVTGVTLEEARSEQRGDTTSHKLYGYSQANSRACVVQ